MGWLNSGISEKLDLVIQWQRELDRDLTSLKSELAKGIYDGNANSSTMIKKLDEIIGRVKDIQQKEKIEMTKLDDLEATVSQVKDVEESAVTLLTELHQMLVDAGTDQAKLDAIKDKLSTSKDALAAAVVANTPAANG